MNSTQTLKLTALTLLLFLLPGAHDASAQSVRRLRLVRGAAGRAVAARPRNFYRPACVLTAAQSAT